MAGSLLSAPKHIRARWYLQVEKYHKTIAETCDVFGISAKTYHKWYKKDHPLVRGGGKPPRRVHPHTKIIGLVMVQLMAAKRLYNFGPLKMHHYLKQQFAVVVSAAAIYKFFKKKRLIRKPQRQQKWYQPLKHPYYAQYPGDNVQLDVKYVPGEDKTWNYEFRFIDQVTNLQYTKIMPIKDALSTIIAYKSAQKHFPFPIMGIQTDNGGEFRGRFHAFLVRIQIIHRYIPKRSAPWNGKVERANRSVDDEFYLNPHRPWKTIEAYTRWYNHERPHLGKEMDGQTPFTKFLSLEEKKV